MPFAVHAGRCSVLLLVIRLVSALMGLTLAYSVLTGGMTVRIFVVPDLILSAGLALAAAMPRATAPRALLAANAFAAAVFTVAVSRYVIEDGRVNPPLIVFLLLACGQALFLLVAPRRITG
jgi:hypothetical protein